MCKIERWKINEKMSKEIKKGYESIRNGLFIGLREHQDFWVLIEKVSDYRLHLLHWRNKQKIYLYGVVQMEMSKYFCRKSWNIMLGVHLVQGWIRDKNYFLQQHLSLPLKWMKLVFYLHFFGCQHDYPGWLISWIMKIKI